MSTEWITLRQPTKADEDLHGQVLMKRFPNAQQWIGACVSSAHVGPGVPWRHTILWKPMALADQPPTAPAPPVPVAAPTATQVSAVLTVLSGATPFYVVVASDGESPLAWETDVLTSGTLRECLKQQRILLGKYQNVMIAECKIIPELAKP